MEGVNDELREQIFEAVNSQLESNTPPEVNVTFNRLLVQGYDEFQTRQLIG